MELLCWLRGLKNLRGVVFFSQSGEKITSSLKELKRYHRYRNLGIAPSLAENFDLAEISQPPFIILNIPEPHLESWLEDFKTRRNFSALQTLVLSLIYLVPIVFLDGESLKVFDSWEIWRYSLTKLPELKEQIRHLRILSYAMIDFLLKEELVIKELEYSSFSPSARRELVAHYQELLDQDAYRYWRVKGKGDQPWLLGFSLLKKLGRKELAPAQASPLFPLLLGISLGLRWT